MKTLTADTIERYYPCQDKLEIFKAEWPKGMPVTRKSLRRALMLGIELDDWEWFISASFPEALLAMYNKDVDFPAELGLALSGAEYDAFGFEWAYHYLSGIRKAQLNACEPDAMVAPGPPA